MTYLIVDGFNGTQFTVEASSHEEAFTKVKDAGAYLMDDGESHEETIICALLPAAENGVTLLFDQDTWGDAGGPLDNEVWFNAATGKKEQ